MMSGYSNSLSLLSSIFTFLPIEELAHRNNLLAIYHDQNYQGS